MSIGLIVILLIIAFYAIRTIQYNEREKERERKRLEEARRKRLEEQKEMKQLKLDEKGYKLHKLKQINNIYLLDNSLKENIPSSIAIHKQSNKKTVVTFDVTNQSKIWDKTDNKLLFLLFNCSAIVSFDTIDYNELIHTYTGGQFRDLLEYDFREILLANLEAKTVRIKRLLKENNITETQRVRGLVNANFDKKIIREIESNSGHIFTLRNEIERIDDWLIYKSSGSPGAVNWANRKEDETSRIISFQYIAQEAKGIYYLNELIKSQGKISIVVSVDKHQMIMTKEVQLSLYT